mgnify:CR=1 FL=1
MKVAASPRSRAQVAAVLAFVISHTTFLAAQDDETGRCPKADFFLFPEEGARGWSGRCPKFETSGFLVSQTQSLATNPQLLISSHQSPPLVFLFPHAIINLGFNIIISRGRALARGLSFV